MGWSNEEKVKRAIIHQLLRDDRGPRWTREEIEQAMTGFETEAVEVAIEDLLAEGVAEESGVTIKASICARTLDALGLVGI